MLQVSLIYYDLDYDLHDAGIFFSLLVNIVFINGK